MTGERRELAWDGCRNTRDLGGLAVEGGVVAAGAVVRTDCVASLTPGGWASLLRHGARTVVDLRTIEEAQRIPVRPPVGVAWERVPIVDVVPAGEQANPPAWSETYRMMLDRYQRGFAAAITATDQAAPGGVVVQCHLGRDRTGIVIGLLLLLAGATAETVCADHALSRAQLDAAFAAWIAEDQDPARRRITEWQRAQPPELMGDAIEHLHNRHGGVERYLLDGGAETGIAARLRARLVPEG